MKRDDNQHRNRAIRCLRESLNLVGLEYESADAAAETIVDAIMDAVKEEMERPLVWKGSPEDAQKILDAEDGKMVEITDFPVLSPSKTTPNQNSLDTPLET